VIALAIVNTILGASTGGMSVLFMGKFIWGDAKKWSFLMTLNGALCGMVSMCAGCNVYEPWAALLIGGFAGFFFLAVHTLMLKFKLDDPLDAVAVHGAGGLWGLIAVPFFMSAGLEDGQRGILFDGHLSHPWTVLGVNIAGGLAITTWAVVWSVLLFGGLKMAKMLRVTTDEEFKGMDLMKHGEAAYPAGAWVEYQYNKNTAGGPSINPVMGATNSDIGAVMTMSGAVDGKKQQDAYNNPFEMIPTTGKLMKQMSSTFVPTAGAGSGARNGGVQGQDNVAMELRE